MSLEYRQCLLAGGLEAKAPVGLISGGSRRMHYRVRNALQEMQGRPVYANRRGHTGRFLRIVSYLRARLGRGPRIRRGRPS